jgi:hypothetical protein
MEVISEFRQSCRWLSSGQNVHQANNWLLLFSQRDDCWKLCIQVLRGGETPLESDSSHELFFAAKILYCAIQSSWFTFEQIDQAQVRDMIAFRLFQDSFSDVIVKNQLCRGLAAIFCRCTSDDEIHSLCNATLSLDLSNLGWLTL